MSYICPEEVLSPKNSVKQVVEVIHDPGPEDMCVARILWRGEERVAIRWNGTSEEPKGNPTSHGQPTWFVVGEYAAQAVEEAARRAAQESPNGLVSKYREMAADSEREQEAEEWSEGLIADGSTER